MKFVRILIRKIKTATKEPKWLLIRPLILISPLLEETLYLRMMFYVCLNQKLDLDSPKTFNEKLQWLKINYRKPIMTVLADKYEAKKYTAALIGEEYVVKTLGIWDSFDQINFDQLPSQFVLKTTHDSGGVVVCKDKSVFDYDLCKKKLNKHLKSKNYFFSREWPYKNIKPRIIAEELLVDNEKKDLWDYKFYCFNGVPKLMYIAMGRQGSHVPFYFYDMDFNLLDLRRPNHKPDGKLIERPKHLDHMIQLAAKMSAGFPHLRIDFYCIQDRVLSGEYTFFQGGGLMPFEPASWDYKMGDWIDLDNIE